MKGLNAFKIHVFFFKNHINLTIGFEISNSASVDSNVDFPQIVIEKGATKRGIQR